MSSVLEVAWKTGQLDQPHALHSSSLHCWSFDIRQPVEAKTLHPDEIKRAQTMEPGRAQLFQLGRHYLRSLLGSYLKERGEMLQITTSDSGKPCLRDHPELQFNLAHNDNELLIALSSSPVGVDLESPQRQLSRQRIDAIARRLFRADSESFSDQAAFLSAWTAHEAGQKLHGDGVFGQRATPKHLVPFMTPIGNIAAVATDLMQLDQPAFFSFADNST